MTIRWAAALTWLAAAAGTLAACQAPYSNEDLLFLYEGVPRDIEVTIPTPEGTTGVGTPGGAPAPEAARFYAESVAAADAINRDVLSLLGLVDAIVAQPPTQRLEDLRVWGPLPGGGDLRLTLRAQRVRTSTVFRATSTSIPARTDAYFDYVMFGSSPQQPEAVPLFAGRQVADPNGVQGTLYIDLDQWGRVEPQRTDRGQVLVAYDARFGELILELAFGAVADGAEPTTGWRHAYDASGRGTFVFAVRDDSVPTTDAQELWLVSVRWRPDRHGRADVVLTGGDVGLAYLFVSECWDADFRRTYLVSNIPDPDFAPFGRLEGCADDLQTAEFPE